MNPENTMQSQLKNNHGNSAESGFTLIEVLMSMAIFSIGILGMMSSVGVVMDYQRDADDMTQATLLTKQQIEKFKAVGANENSLVGGTYSFDYLVGDYKAVAGLTVATGNTMVATAPPHEVFGKFTRATTMTVMSGGGQNWGDFTVANQPLIRFVKVDVVTTWTGTRGVAKNITLSVVMNRRRIYQQ